MCSLTGVYGLENLTGAVAFKGAYAQQHRGEDGFGFAATNGENIFLDKSLGLVSEGLGEIIERASEELGSMLAAIVHTRYPTEGDANEENTQPIVGETRHGKIVYGHNGELTNFMRLKKTFMENGISFSTTSDSEMFLAAYSSIGNGTLEERLGSAARRLRGAYNIVGITEDTLFAIRDSLGFKPLSIATLNGGYIVSSETTAFLDIEGAEWICDVSPGSVVTINADGMKSSRFAGRRHLKPCVFELEYFARPDSHIAGRNVHLVRVEFGKEVYEEYPADLDVIVAIEDSGRSAAEGMAEVSGIPLKRGLIRNHYIGRTFIRPTDVLRERGVNLKLSPLAEVLRGRRVGLVDDSIVNGNTAKSRVRLVRQAGAEEVHLYITSPKIIDDCIYGIDFHKERLRTTKIPDDTEFMRQIDVDGLHHLSLRGMFKAIRRVKVDSRAGIPYYYRSFCTACMTGNYPVPKERQ